MSVILKDLSLQHIRTMNFKVNANLLICHVQACIFPICRRRVLSRIKSWDISGFLKVLRGYFHYINSIFYTNSGHSLVHCPKKISPVAPRYA